MIDRQTLEAEALKEVCACLYYDLADNIETETDETLTAIVNHTNTCDMCGK